MRLVCNVHSLERGTATTRCSRRGGHQPQGRLAANRVVEVVVESVPKDGTMRFLSWLDAVRGRITDRECKAGRRREARTPVAGQMERLEERSLLSASALFVNGELNIVSDSNESIEIGATTTGTTRTVEVLINGVVASTVSSLPAESITSIVVRGGNLQNVIDLSRVTRDDYANLQTIDVDGGHGADTILGSLDIDETLKGNHGDDVITSQDANSTIFGGDGNDTLTGGAGNDSLLAEDGNDSVTGDDGNDTIDGHDGDDVLEAGAGDDSIIGGDGEDLMLGGDGNDTLNGMMGTDLINGEAGNDSLLGGQGNDSILGEDGDDIILANDGRDTVDAGADNDTVDGGADPDSIVGGDGNDSLNGSAGDDSMFGGTGQDTLIGGGGADSLEGNGGDDVIRGQAGNDTIFGGSGFDVLDGGAGNDTLDAGDAPTEPVPPPPIAARLFAIPDDGRNTIVEIDPTTGLELNRFAAPEPINASGDALAFDGASLFFLNGFGTNTLYELNPDTGAVIDSDVIPRPSNQRYDGLAVLNNVIYIQDAFNDDILAYDPVSDGVINVLDIDGLNPNTNLIGGLAGATGPDRLIATVSSGQTIIEINPLTGLITSSFTPTTSSVGTYRGVGVVDDLIYLGSSRVSAVSALAVASSLDIFNRRGEFQRTLSLPFAVSAFGADDIGTVGVPIVSQGQFDLVLNAPTSLTPSQLAIFSSVEARWEAIIRGDVPDLVVNGQVIDDLVINVNVRAMDGVGNTLGQTIINVQRTGSFLPALATIDIDSADLTALESAGQLDEVLLHEVAHALGFGTIWQETGLLAGAGTTNPRFLGAQATLEYQQRFRTSEPNIPVENTGGLGTADAHWRESRFGNELMSGFLNAGANPLSRITIASLSDLGYQVDINQADQYMPSTLSSSLAASSVSGSSVLVVSGGSSLGSRSVLNGRWLLPDVPSRMVTPLQPGDVRPWTPPRTNTSGAFSTSAGNATTVIGGSTGSQSVRATALPARAAAPTTITFTELPATAADNVSLLGATFDFKVGAVDSTDATFGAIGIADASSLVGLSDPVLEGNASGVLSIDFSAPATDVSFNVARSTGNPVTNGVRVTLFDTNLNVISTTNVNLIPQLIFAEGTFSYTGTTGVRRMQLDFTSASALSGGSRFALDNLSFNLGGAPTPGTLGGDTLIGGDGNDLLIGRDGNDVFNGNAGNDTIDAGDGNDSIQGGIGNDSINGGLGNDTLKGNGGSDTLLGDAGDDLFIVLTDEGVDSLDGGDGSDTFEMRGSTGADTFDVGKEFGRLTVSIGATKQTAESNIELIHVQGLGGNDRINVHDLSGVGATELRLSGGNGNDRIIADAGAKLSDIRLGIFGDAGNDSLVGTDSAESLSGGDGNDTLEGNGGNDTLDGGAGNDSIDGGAGNDVAFGGDGLATINGGDGDDSLTGSVLNDVLDGGAGNDTLVGLNGDDALNGMDGDDSLVGGSDNDSLLGGAGNDTLDGGTDNDTLNGQDGNDRLIGFHGHDLIWGGLGNDTIFGGDGNDLITAEGGDDLIDAGDGNDLVQGNDGNDVLLGGDGNDTLRGGAGNDIALGGDGNDFVDGQGGSYDTVAGGEGTDIVIAIAGELNELFQLPLNILDKFL